MSEKLIVKNFGPIKDAEIDLKKVTIFIGEQAGGKSTLAKLVAIFQELNPLYPLPNYFKVLLKNQGLISYIKNNSNLFYENKNIFINGLSSNSNNFGFTFNIKNEYYQSLYDSHFDLQNDLTFNIYEKDNAILKQNYERAKHYSDVENNLKKEIENLRKELSVFHSKPVYYPTERYLLSAISNAINNFLKNEIPIPPSIIQFGSLFEEAISFIQNFNLPKFGLKYKSENKTLKINYKSTKFLDLRFSSSGLQSIFPLLLVIEYFNIIYDNQKKTNNNKISYKHITEEPELNLYPTTQKKLVEYLISKCTKEKNSLVVTTHSPYILSTFDNCIQAGNVVKSRPELKEKVESIISSEYHLDYDDVAVYYVANGEVKSIMDEEYKGIDTNAIDDVSEELGAIFDDLLTLQYQK